MAELILDEDVDRFQDAFDKAIGIITVPEEQSPGEIREALEAAVPPILDREFTVPRKLAQIAMDIHQAGPTVPYETVLRGLLAARRQYRDRPLMLGILERLAPAAGRYWTGAAGLAICGFCSAFGGSHNERCAWVAVRAFLDGPKTSPPTVGPEPRPAPVQGTLEVG